MRVIDRFDMYMKHKGLNDNNVTVQSGLSIGLLGKARKEGSDLGKSSINKLLNFYTDIDEEWLLHGKDGIDEMLSIQHIEEFSIKQIEEKYHVKITDKDHGIPFYEVDVNLGFVEVINDQTTVPTYFIDVPAFRDCDCAVPAYGSSMTPAIEDGAIIAIKQIQIEDVLPGEAYYIVTDSYRTVKYLRTCKEDPEKIRLVPKNLNDYDESVIDKRKIRRLFLVKGVITNKIG